MNTEDKPREDECGYVSAQGVRATARITMHDLVATAYERGTGKKLGKKLFPAAKSCDTSVTAANFNLASQDTFPSTSAMVAWAASVAK